MFAPGAALLMKEFHQTSATVGTLAVTIYLLGFTLGYPRPDTYCSVV